jgi:hypothetical protein
MRLGAKTPLGALIGKIALLGRLGLVHLKPQ